MRHEPINHDWRGQTQYDEWGGRSPLSLFVCASCGAIWHPRSPTRWAAPCPGDGLSHRERYALPKGRRL